MSMLRTASWFLIITTGVCFGQQPTAKEMPQEMVWVSRQGDILERGRRSPEFHLLP